MRLPLVAAAVAVVLACNLSIAGVQGNGKVRTEARTVPAYQTVSVGGAFDVDVTIAPGQPASVSITGDDNILPLVRTVVKHGSLEIDTRESYSSKNTLRIKIVNPTVTALSVSGDTTGVVRGISGDAFAVDVSGSGELELIGAVDRLAIGVSGSAELAARALAANNVAVHVSGSGRAQLSAARTLAVSVSGSAVIDYWGKPSVTRSISGSAEINGH